MIKEMGINCQHLRECKSYFLEKFSFDEQEMQGNEDQNFLSYQNNLLSSSF